jgi:hypothetical protein
MANGGAPPDQRAIEEWRQLRTVINNGIEQQFKVRYWLLILLTALLAAVYADKMNLGAGVFVIVSLLLTICLAFVELVVREFKRRAIDRCRAVEASLRYPAKAEYDGPQIEESLGACWDLKATIPQLLQEAKFFTFWTFYVAIWLVVLLLAIAAFSSQGRDAKPGEASVAGKSM